MKNTLLILIASVSFLSINAQDFAQDLTLTLSKFSSTIYDAQIASIHTIGGVETFNDTINEGSDSMKWYFKSNDVHFIMKNNQSFISAKLDNDTMFVGENLNSLDGYPTSSVNDLILMFQDILNHVFAYNISYLGLVNNERKYTVSNGDRMTMEVYFDNTSNILTHYSMFINRNGSTQNISTYIISFQNLILNTSYYSNSYYYNIEGNSKLPSVNFPNFIIIED